MRQSGSIIESIWSVTEQFRLKWYPIGPTYRKSIRSWGYGQVINEIYNYKANQKPSIRIDRT